MRATTDFSTLFYNSCQNGRKNNRTSAILAENFNSNIIIRTSKKAGGTHKTKAFGDRNTEKHTFKSSILATKKNKLAPFTNKTRILHKKILTNTCIIEKSL